MAGCMAGMTWLLMVTLVTPLLFAGSSANTTPELPADVLNNLAALQSAENILEHIEDLTNTSNSDTPSSATTTIAIDKESTKQTSVIDSDPLLENGRRFAGAPPPLDTRDNNVKGLEVLYEIKRLLQQAQNNMTPPPGQPLPQFSPQIQSTSSQPIFPYYGLPPRVIAGQPGYMYPPDQQTTQPQDLIGFTNYAQPVTKLLERDVPIFRRAPGAQPLPAFHESPPSHHVPRPQPRTPLQASSTDIPSEWLLRDIAQARRVQRPIGSQSMASRLPGQPSYSQFPSLSTPEIISTLPADVLEAEAKLMTRSRWREPPQSSNTPLPTPLLPQRPMLTVALPPLPPRPPRPVPRAIVNAQLPKNMRPTANALPQAHSRQRLPVNAAQRVLMVSQLPARRTPKRHQVISVTDNAEKLQKLMTFIKQNRDALLQFIAMRRRQLLAAANGHNRAENGVAVFNQNNVRNLVRPRPVVEALIRSNGGDGNALKTGKGLGEGKDTTSARAVQAMGYISGRPRVIPRPIIRALPDGYPEQLFDLAPAKGSNIEHMRNRDRICQRNVMQVSGPKYDRLARVRQREFRPGVDGRAFRVTKRKRLLLPACCNCCKKSVLGCQ